MNYQEAVALLTVAGSPFEIVTETVRGRPMKVFKTRERSMREKVAASAIHGDKEFMVSGDQRTSFTSFVEQVWGAGHALVEKHGLRHHDRIGILAYNRPEWLIALFGGAAVGGISVGLNGWWTGEELEYALTDSGCRYLIVDDLLYSRARPVLAKAKSLETVFYIGDHPPEGTVPIASLLQRRTDVPTVPIEEDDPFVILYTSGTTGRSKGCITTHRGTIAQVQGILYNFFVAALLMPVDPSEPPPPDPLASQPAALLTSPLFHVAGLHSTVCTSITGGAKLVFGPPKFEPEQVLQIMEREKITTWMAIPTLLQRLIEHPAVADYDLSMLNTISTGGAPTAPETAERARQVLKAKPSLSTSYGLTEVHGMATSITGDEYLARKTSVGRAIPVMDIRIIDDEGNDRPVGLPGQILLSGPTVTPGYWNRLDATEETLKDGWLYTGDVGYLDADGYLYISDRTKDMIIRGGENVYCQEIENVLQEHPEILEAAVIGVPDRDLGERVKAVVVCAPGSQLTHEEIKAHVARRLAKFKVPELVELSLDALPRNPAGKLLKNILRKTGTVSFPPDTHL
jgi:long-chain acyl-CoA synthetase